MSSRVLVAYAEVAAHDLLRSEVARFHGVSRDRVVLGHACGRCGSDEHGRPLVLPTASLREPAAVSLARAGAMSVVAVTDLGPIGVDVELPGAADFPGFPTVAAHLPGTDPTRTWVRTEALVKALGTGLVLDPRHVRLDETGVVRWESDQPRPPHARVLDVDVPRHVVSVVVLTGHDDVAVEVRGLD